MDVKVIRTEETTAFTPGAGAQKLFRTFFMVGDNGPFTIDLTAAEFQPARVKEEIERVAATLRAIA